MLYLNLIDFYELILYSLKCQSILNYLFHSHLTELLKLFHNIPKLMDNFLYDSRQLQYLSKFQLFSSNLHTKEFLDTITTLSLIFQTFVNYWLFIYQGVDQIALCSLHQY